MVLSNTRSSLSQSKLSQLFTVHDERYAWLSLSGLSLIPGKDYSSDMLDCSNGLVRLRLISPSFLGLMR